MSIVKSDQAALDDTTQGDTLRSMDLCPVNKKKGRRRALQSQLALTGLSPGDWQCLADQPPLPKPLRPHRNAVQVGQEKSADCFETRMTRRTPNHQRLGGEYHLPLSELSAPMPFRMEDAFFSFSRDPGCRCQAAAGILLPASLVCLSLTAAAQSSTHPMLF